MDTRTGAAVLPTCIVYKCVSPRSFVSLWMLPSMFQTVPSTKTWKSHSYQTQPSSATPPSTPPQPPDLIRQSEPSPHSLSQGDGPGIYWCPVCDVRIGALLSLLEKQEETIGKQRFWIHNIRRKGPDFGAFHARLGLTVPNCRAHKALQSLRSVLWPKSEKNRRRRWKPKGTADRGAICYEGYLVHIYMRDSN